MNNQYLSTETAMIQTPTSFPKKTWQIYCLSIDEDPRHYVGLTSLPLEDRLRGHAYEASRDNRHPRPGSLGAALRASGDRGRCLIERMSIWCLATTCDPQDAQRLEHKFIEELSTRIPHGFNAAAAGSLGGPLNARPVTIRPPGEGMLACTSINEAIVRTNAARRAIGEQELDPGSVYARLTMGWTADEALGHMFHQDGRRAREPLFWGTESFTELRALSDRTGVNLSTLRSRLHRARLAGLEDCDIAYDRRRGRAPRKVPSRIELPHPTDPTRVVNSAVFARLSGVARATVIHRAGKLNRRPGGLVGLERQTLLAALLDDDDRRIVITLPLPGGRVQRGGVREVIRFVFADAQLLEQRLEWVGASAIRARLRRLPGWPHNICPDAVASAFGFQRRNV
jgi:hypothetical protein